VDYLTDRQQRWLAVGVTTILLAGGALGAVDGRPVVVLAVAICAPFIAALLSGRSAGGTVRAGLAGMVAVWVVLGSLMLDGAGSGYPIFVGLLAAFVFRWEEDAQLAARLIAVVIAGVGVWALSSYAWEAHWLLLVAIPPVLAVGLADEVADMFTDGGDLPPFAELGTISKGRKLAWGTWACVALAVLSHMLEVGSPLVFGLAAVVLGISGAVASFAEPPGEGEVRAATVAMSITPPLIIFGLIALLFVLLASSDEPWW
jgi:hypothetical protein